MGAVNHHRHEIGLLALMTVVVGFLAGWAIAKGSAGESAAWSAILMAIVNSIKERWQSRTIDRMGENLQRSNPADGSPSGRAGDPVHVEPGAGVAPGNEGTDDNATTDR